jgi:hypothetical protein
VLGVVANRRMQVDLEDFLLYGRRAGFVVLYLTVVATFHSAFAFLGSGGFFYTHGIGFWAAGTWTVLVGAITYVLGTRIWALGKRSATSRRPTCSPTSTSREAVRVTVAVVSVVFTILYIQVQAQGLGYIINVASGGRISIALGTLVLLRGRGRVPDGGRAARGLLDGRAPGRLDVPRRLDRRAGARVRALRWAARALARRRRRAARPAHAPRPAASSRRACGSA